MSGTELPAGSRVESFAGVGNNPPAALQLAGQAGGQTPATASRYTPKGLASLRAAGHAVLRSPEVLARARAAYEANHGWNAETQAQVREWAAAKIAVREMARRLGADTNTVVSRAKKYGIDLRGPVAASYEAGGEVLKQHYGTTMPFEQIRELYSAARGRKMSVRPIRVHAAQLGLRRPTKGWAHPVGQQRAEDYRAQRLARRDDVQRMLDQHATIEQITRALGMSRTRLGNMLKEGMVVRPPPPPKAAKPPRFRAAPKPTKPPAPRKLPASYVRAAAEPAKPKPTYESVEAWLAAGNAITRCPTVAALPTTATIPEADRLAMVALYAARASEWNRKGKRRWGGSL
jgi:hypothetical protein